MTQSFPNESREYRTARDKLLEQELELRRQIERVAAARRDLPLGGAIEEDYIFHAFDADSRPTEIRFSELFAPGKDTLAVYSFMYAPTWEHACPLCTSILDALDGQVVHLDQQITFAVVAKAPLKTLQDHARDRGWTRLRLLSSMNNSYQEDYLAQPVGNANEQLPMLNIFQKSVDDIYHTWGSELLYEPMDEGQDSRHVDSIWPLWNLLDLTPQGRGGFYPKLSYE